MTTGLNTPTARPDLSERAYLLTVPFQATVKSLCGERAVDAGKGAPLSLIYAPSPDGLREARMRRPLVFALALALSTTGAWVDERDDCNQPADADRQGRGKPQQGGWDA